MGLFDIFKKKGKLQNQASDSTKSVKATVVPQENDPCARCKSTLSTNMMNKGNLNQNISWEIKDSVLYLSGKGILTKDDYLTITAPAPRYETITYNRVLPWAVCPCIRKDGYIGEGCPVENIPNYIKRIVVNGEISGLKEFLLNSEDWIGIKLQPAKEYFDLSDTNIF